MTELLCHRCGHMGEPQLTWQLLANGYHHLRASCPQCSRYIKFVPQTPEAVERAGPKPPPPPAQQHLFSDTD